jgi:hypothetical protein
MNPYLAIAHAIIEAARKVPEPRVAAVAAASHVAVHLADRVAPLKKAKAAVKPAKPRP